MGNSTEISKASKVGIWSLSRGRTLDAITLATAFAPGLQHVSVVLCLPQT